MAKQEREVAARHTVHIEDRSSVMLEGVKEVKGFSDSSVSLLTTRGALLIQGKGLNISRLNTDSGELFVGGEINRLSYSKDKKRGSVLEGLLK